MLAPVLTGLFDTVLMQGRVAEALPGAQEMLDLAEVTGDADLLIAAHASACEGHFWADNTGQKEATLTKRQRGGGWTRKTPLKGSLLHASSQAGPVFGFTAMAGEGYRIDCDSAWKKDPVLECTPVGGQNQAGALTVWRAC